MKNVGTSTDRTNRVNKTDLLELILVGNNCDANLPTIPAFFIELLDFLTFLLIKVHVDIGFEVANLSYPFPI